MNQQIQAGKISLMSETKQAILELCRQALGIWLHSRGTPSLTDDSSSLRTQICSPANAPVTPQVPSQYPVSDMAAQQVAGISAKSTGPIPLFAEFQAGSQSSVMMPSMMHPGDTPLPRSLSYVDGQFPPELQQSSFQHSEDLPFNPQDMNWHRYPYQPLQ